MASHFAAQTLPPPVAGRTVGAVLTPLAPRQSPNPAPELPDDAVASGVVHAALNGGAFMPLALHLCGREGRRGEAL